MSLFKPLAWIAIAAVLSLALIGSCSPPAGGGGGGPGNTCVAEGQACTANLDCCAGLTCDDGTCQQEDTPCNARGEACTSNLDCCEGLNCEEGTCQLDAIEPDEDGGLIPPEGDILDFQLPAPLTILFPRGATDPAPVTVGVPLPTGSFRIDELTVIGPSGAIPTQVRQAAQLGEASGVTWVLVDFQAEPDVSYSLDTGSPPEPSEQVQVSDRGGGGVVVDTGAGRWEIPATSDLLASAVGPDSTTLATGATWGEDASAEVEVVDAGPMRAMVRVQAREAVSGLDLVGRLHFYAGLPYARFRITLTNHNDCPESSDAPGSDNGACGLEDGQPVCNGLLSAGRIEIDDASWTLILADASGTDEEIYQDSSGADNWGYYVGLEPRMQSGVTRRGYVHTRGGVEVGQGDVADGILAAGGVQLYVPWFRELFPKALRVRDGNLEFGVFPGEFVHPHRLRAGEQKTHDVWVSLDPEVTPPWPVYATPSFGYLRGSHALGYIGPRVAGEFDEYENYLDDQFEASAHTVDDCNNDLDDCALSILEARERWEYFGWTDFGDVPTDHENPRSPFNPKYDLNLGYLHQALRTDDVRWWGLAHALNIHFADIDILHSRVRGYDADRSWFEGGTWGHSYHNEEGLTNPHRNCANQHPDLYYGGIWRGARGDR